jgi:hypothetical protein
VELKAYGFHLEKGGIKGEVELKVYGFPLGKVELKTYGVAIFWEGIKAAIF